MPRISYYLKDGLGIWTDIGDDAEGALEIRFTPTRDGYVKIGKEAYRVAKGEVSIPLSAVPDGVNAARFYTDSEGFKLETFIKSASTVTMEKTDDITVRAMLERIRKLEERLIPLEKSAEVLIQRTEGHRIFN